MSTLHAPPQDRLDTLVDRGVLTPEQLVAVREAIGHLPETLPAALPIQEPAGPEARPPSRRLLLAELAGYVGGALAFAAGAVALGTGWDELGRWGRTGVFLAIAVIALVAAVAIRGRAVSISDRRQRLVSTLATLTAGASGAALGVGMAGTWSGPSCVLAGGLAAAAIALAGYGWTPSVIGHFGGYAGLLVGLSGLLRVVEANAGLVGLAVGGLGLVWIAVVVAGLLPELDAGLALGTGTLFVGTQMLMAHHLSTGLAVLGVAGVGAFALYLARRSGVLLVAGVVFLTVTAVRALAQYAPGSLAAPLALLAGAAMLLAASWFGLRLRHRGDGTLDASDDGEPHLLRRTPQWPQFPQQRNRR